MLELVGNQLVFSFPEIHEHAKLAIEFQRTLRIPDDDKNYPLPPGLGQFPMKHTDDYADELPSHWKEHGGVFLPMYQAEALWVNFKPIHVPGRGHAYPFIVKVGTGKKSALTGKDWRKGLHKGDYCSVPPQPWLDGYVVEDGLIRQFVAVPLGSGLSVEEQLGGDGIGGIQIEVYPMKSDCFDRRWPKPVPRPTRGVECYGGGVRLGRRSRKGAGGQTKSAESFSYDSRNAVGAASAAMDFAPDGDDCCRGLDINLESKTLGEMSLGAGGQMAQQVFEDPYGKDEWSRKSNGPRRVFVHLANSMAWSTITGEKPPETPATAAAYERYGMPWYDFYSDDLQAKKGSKKLRGVKSVKDAAKAKGMKGVLPENKSVKPKNILVVDPNEVRNGTW